MKRVLLTTHPSAYLHKGGGEQEIFLLQEALKKSGVIADLYGPTCNTVSAYDFAIHSSLVPGSEYLVQPLAEAGIRLILWPNLWFVTPPSSEQLANISNILSHFEAVVFRSHAEEAHFRQFLNLDGKRIIHVSCLISDRFSRRDITDIFRQSYGLKKYAIWPGIIEPQKNQLAAVRAFRELDISLVISGRVRNQEYLKQCMAEAGPNTYFIPPMPFGSDLHLSALAHSDLFIELPLDFPGTSAVEAATLNCNLLLSRCAWTEEMFGKQCHQVDPTDENAITSAVADAIKNPSQDRTIKMQQRASETSLKPLVVYVNEKARLR